LAKQNLSVLIWDADAQGGTSFFFNTHNQNANQYKKLFCGDSSIYNTIQHADIYHIDVISNDAHFSDTTMQQSYGMSKIDYLNGTALQEILKTVTDDYDVCLIDCPPGKSTLHQNIFAAAHLVMVPTIPSALSMNCVYQLLEEFAKTKQTVLSFFNMVQIRKKLHKHFMEQANNSHHSLQHYIPFYTEIETISYNKQSIFHALKESKSLVFYENVWTEICNTMCWPIFNISNKGKVISIDQPIAESYGNAAFEDAHYTMEEPYSNVQVAQMYSY
jgi:chromosome partitioning protein